MAIEAHESARQHLYVPEFVSTKSGTGRCILTVVTRVAVSPADIPLPRDGSRDVLIMLQGTYVVTAAPLDGFPPGSIGMSDAQRTWMGIALTDTVNAEMYDPFSQGGQAYLGSMDVEIGFASQKKRTDKPYDQDHLANEVIKVTVLPVFCKEVSLTIYRYARTRSSRPVRDSC